MIAAQQHHVKMSWIEKSVEYFREAQISSLSVDEAFLNVTSHQNRPIWLYSLSAECYRCPFIRIREIQKHSHQLLKVDTAFDFKYRIYDSDVGNYAFENATGQICEVAGDFGEFGVYDLEVDSGGNCDLNIANHPVNIFLREFLIKFNCS